MSLIMGACGVFAAFCACTSISSLNLLKVLLSLNLLFLDNGDLSLMVIAEKSQKRFLIVSINESLDVYVYFSLILNGFKPQL